jgi:hypothetical protein
MNMDVLFLSLIIVALGYGVVMFMEHKDYLQQKFRELFRR